MAIILSSAPVRYTPDHYKGNETAPVYLVQPATRRQRAQFRAKLLEDGLRMPSDSEVIEALRTGASSVIVAQELPEINEMLDRLQAKQEFDDMDREKLRLLENELYRAPYLPYTQVAAARELWSSLAPVIAAQMFLTGWENVNGEFQRHNGMVTEQTLDAISENDVTLIGWHALSLFQPSKEEEKNSASPPALPPSP